MDLKTYLETHRISQEKFGKSLRNPVTQGMVWQWINGAPITVERAREIVEATAGQVTAHDCLPTVFPEGFVFPTEERAA